MDEGAVFDAATLHTTRAVSHWAEGALAEAEEAFTRALLTDPSCVPALVSYAELLRSRGVILKAERLLRNARRERQDRARDYFDTQTTVAESVQQMRTFLRGVWLEECANDSIAAEECYHKATPYAGAFRRLAKLAMARGEGEEAQRMFQLASDQGDGQAQDACARWHLLHGNSVDGEALLAQAAICVVPEAAHTLWRRQRTLLEELRRSAELGYAAAQRDMGIMLWEEAPLDAAAWFHRAALKGDASAQRWLGRLYLSGDKPDTDAGLAWLHEASRHGDVEATARLGLALVDDVALDQCAWMEGIQCLERISENMDVQDDDDDDDEEEEEEKKQQRIWRAKACARLARCTASGTHGVERCVSRAVALHTRAATLGDVDSMHILGDLYASGEMVERDLKLADEWFQRAGEQGDAAAAERVGALKLEMGDVEAASPWLRRAAEAGRPASQLALASLHIKGNGVLADVTAALRWARRAFDRGGLSPAGFVLAVWNEDGRYLARDVEEALHWYCRAAEAGDVTAQFRLARTYLVVDLGVGPDAGAAKMWMERVGLCVSEVLRTCAAHSASDLISWWDGTPGARDPWKLTEVGREIRLSTLYAFAVCLEEGIGVPVNLAFARALYEECMDAGKQDAAFRLGVMDLTGSGGSENPVRAGTLLRSAAHAGMKEAIRILAWALLDGKVEGKDQETRDLLKKAAESGHAPSQYRFAKLLETEGSAAMAARWEALAADCGVVEAQLSLGHRFDTGMGVVANPEKALQWYTRAAEEGESSMAMRILGERHARNDPARAAHWWRRASECGDADAQILLAQALQEGVGVPRDVSEATLWLEKAATHGKAEAAWELGKLMLATREDGYEQKAAQWFSRAADAGHTEGIVMWATCLVDGFGTTTNGDEAVKYFALGAEANHPVALFQLGRMYQDGVGVPVDSLHAANLVRRSAELGYRRAQYLWGRCLEEGRGTPVDPSQAMEMYRACSQNITPESTDGEELVEVWDAIFRLGMACLRGVGRTKDVVRGVDEILQAAVEGGHAQACVEGALCLLSGTGVDKDPVRAVALLRTGAQQKNPGAMYRLALCLRDGIGCLKDTDEAVRLLHLASSEGSIDATFALGTMYKKGNAVDKDPDRAIRLLREAAQAGHPLALRFVRAVAWEDVS